MKIAIHNAQFSTHVGGTERLISTQIKGLLEQSELNITLITMKTKKPSFLFKEIKDLKNNRLTIIEIEPKFNNHNFTSNDARKWHIESLSFGIATQKVYFESKFDLVITHFATDSLFIPLTQCNILHLHGTITNYSEIGEISLRRPDFFIAVSNYVKEKWVAFYPFLKSKKIEIIYPGVETKKFKRLNSIKKLDLLYVGRLIKIKGVDDLLSSLVYVNRNARLIIVGDGPEKINLIKKVKFLGLEKRVNFISRVSENALIKLYNLSKIAVFPSYAKEGLLLTMLEAASCGTPVITSNACSMPEFIINKENGLLFEPRNYKDLATKINLLLADDKLRIKLGKNALEISRKKFDTHLKVYELYKKYKEISALCKKE